MSSQILGHLPELRKIVFHPQVDQRGLLREILRDFLELLVDGG
jgi:hypothetical protein